MIDTDWLSRFPYFFGFLLLHVKHNHAMFRFRLSPTVQKSSQPDRSQTTLFRPVIITS
jgi:hypothetical protein